MKIPFNKKMIIDMLFVFAGSIIYSVAIPMFIAPAHISPGGFSGIALIFNYLLKLPTGLMIFILNIPVFLVGYKKLGKKFIVSTVAATWTISVLLDVAEKLIKPFYGDKILCAVFGGILVGLGLGLILLRGVTTGGVDVIARLVNSKKPHFSVGRIILISDIIVVTLSVICYRDVAGALYSMITIYITSVVLDSVLYGGDKGKLIFAVSMKGEIISKRIISKMNRGVTLISGVGGYTGENKSVIMCAVRRNEIAALYNSIREVDSSAFIIVCDAGEISGNGFEK